MRVTSRLVEVRQRTRQEAGTIALGDCEQGRLDVEAPIAAPALPFAEPGEVRNVRPCSGKDLVEPELLF